MSSIFAALAFLSGVLALLGLPTAPGSAAVLTAAAIAALGLALRHFAIGRAMAWACCGFLFASLHAMHHLRSSWPQAAADERVRAEAVVESIPVARGAGWLFDASVRVEAPHSMKERLRARVISRDPAVRPRAGERWHLLLALRPPRATLNPGAVDVERLLFHDRIHAMGTVVASRVNRRLDPASRPLVALRERIARHIEQRVIDRDAAALIAALAVGATGAMSREQWRVFNATGTTHLVAISGLHVTLFALVMFGIARVLWSALIWRWIPCIRDNFAAAFGLSAAAAYAVLAGLSVPTQRTLIMLAAWLLARSMARAAAPMQPFALALIAVLLVDPFAPLAAGFWLSFGAMGAILFVTQTRFVQRARLHEATTVQLAVAAVLVPLTFACFGSMSVLGPLVNAVAIPFVSGLLVPVILVALVLVPILPFASDRALALAEWLHNGAWPWLAAVADSPLALAYASPPTWWYALAALGVTAALLPWPWRMRLAAVAGVLPLAAANTGAPPQGGAELTALDVGEGTAIVVTTAQHVLAYGTGESYGTDGNRAEGVLVPFLRSRGMRKLDVLVIDRLTPQTGAGVSALFAAMPIERALIGGSAPPDFAGARECAAGQTWMWDDVRFRVLEACALSVETARGQLVIGADRGSATPLVDAAGTPWAIISGRSERNGREAPAITRWRQAGARVIATGEAGAVRVKIDPASGMSEPVGLRSARRALWRPQPHLPP